jgi:hypothetical protein
MSLIMPQPCAHRIRVGMALEESNSWSFLPQLPSPCTSPRWKSYMTIGVAEGMANYCAPVEGRGSGRSTCAYIRRLPPEDIGLLTQPVDRAARFARVRVRYEFVTTLDDVESGASRHATKGIATPYPRLSNSFRADSRRAHWDAAGVGEVCIGRLSNTLW